MTVVGSRSPHDARALAELFEDGEVRRHARRARRIYHLRRDAMVGALRWHLADAARFVTPRGGMSIWCRAEGGNVERWAERALAAGVRFRTARWFTFDGRPRPAFRVGFGALSESQIDAAVRAMKAARPRR